MKVGRQRREFSFRKPAQRRVKCAVTGKMLVVTPGSVGHHRSLRFDPATGEVGQRLASGRGTGEHRYAEATGFRHLQSSDWSANYVSLQLRPDRRIRAATDGAQFANLAPGLAENFE